MASCVKTNSLPSYAKHDRGESPHVWRRFFNVW